MLAEAGLAYAHRFGVAVGRRVGLFVTNQGGARVAQALKASGVEVAAVVDARDGGAVVSTFGGLALTGVVVEEGGLAHDLWRALSG